MADRIEASLDNSSAKPGQTPPVRGDVEGCALPCPDVAMVTELSGIVGANAARGVVAENQRQPPAVSVAHRLEQHLRSRHRSRRSSIATGSTVTSVPSSWSPDKVVSQKKSIDPGACERLQGIIGRRHQRFLVVERGVEHERNAGELSKSTDQRVEQRILLRVDQLHAAGSVLMHHGRNAAPLDRADRVGQDHETPARSGPVAVARHREPALGVFGKDRRAERPEWLAVLDAAIELIANASAARVCQQRAVAQRPRAELHAPLKPADDLPLGDQ